MDKPYPCHVLMQEVIGTKIQILISRKYQYHYKYKYNKPIPMPCPHRHQHTNRNANNIMISTNITKPKVPKADKSCLTPKVRQNQDKPRGSDNLMDKTCPSKGVASYWKYQPIQSIIFSNNNNDSHDNK